MWHTMCGALSFLIGAIAIIPVASESSELSLQSSFDHVKYGNETIARSLQTGTKCASSVSVTCRLRANGLPCDGNLRVKKSDCKANNRKIPLPVTITWRYCNDGPTDQQPDGDKLAPIFKKNVKLDTNKNKILPANTCREVISNPNINLCKVGAVMSMKYVGKIPSISNSFCYGFAFRRVRKKWLPEGDCSVTTNVQCTMKEGSDYPGEDCAGNIINRGDKNCEMVPVRFKYQVCFWNVNMNGVSEMNFVKASSFVKFNGDLVSPSINKNKIDSNIRCRETLIDQQIDSCADKAFSVLQVVGKLVFDDTKCRSFSKVKVTPAVVCDFQFILTEIVNNNDGGTYIEIYSPNCKNAIVTEPYSIIRYKGSKKQPSVESVKLKGEMTDAEGFITVCKQNTKVNKKYGKGSCTIEGGSQSSADMKGFDNIALIEGDVNGEYDILDMYGVVGESGLNTDRDFTNARAVRFKNAQNQSPKWNTFQWFTSTSPGDPKGWDTGDTTQTPTLNAPIQKPSVSSPTKAPETKSPETGKGVKPTKAPTRGDKPTKAPTKSKNTPSPTAKDTSPTKNGGGGGKDGGKTPAPTVASPTVGKGADTQKRSRW